MINRYIYILIKEFCSYLFIEKIENKSNLNYVDATGDFRGLSKKTTNLVPVRY